MNELNILQENEEHTEGFEITDDAKADWALRKIAEEKAEYERIKELGEQLIAETAEKIYAAQMKYEQKKDFFTPKLADYFDKVEHKKSKTMETYKLLSGRLVKKIGKVKAEYDQEKLVSWLKERNMTEYIKTKETPAWGEFSKSLDISTGTVAVMPDTGEVVDCVKVIQQPDQFVVEV